jgi:hypothetical protein
MSQQWSVPAWAVVALAVLALLVLGTVLALAASVRTSRRALAAARDEAAQVWTRLAALEERLARPQPEPRPQPHRATDEEFVITHLGEPGRPRDVDVTDPAPLVPAPVFADLVLRESVVQAATLAAGLRRALGPEVRHRIRFEMRREVKRARKQRRADLRAARRDLHARERAAA